MTKLTTNDLYSLEEYAKRREGFRAQAMQHKRARTLSLGDHIILLFEDRLTVQYQIQEMLRVERIFEQAGIQEELDSYNPLIPDGRNFKATAMIEYSDIEARRVALEKLAGIENHFWVSVADAEPVYAIADEDLERGDETKTSAVHFLRFEMTERMVTELKSGASLSMGVDHPQYNESASPLPASIRDVLLGDLR